MESILRHVADRAILIGMLLLHAFFAESQEQLNKAVRRGDAVSDAPVTNAANHEKEHNDKDRLWYIPSQYKLQYAGGIGFMSAGFGYEVSPTYQPVLFVGYLSESFGGSQNRVLSVSVKNSFYLSRQPLLKYFRPYAGLSINWGNTNNTFRSLPEYYPDEYYFQNKVHSAPFVGGELYVNLKPNKQIKGMGVYAELSALDAYLLEAIRTQYVKPHMALTLALGLTVYIN
ncbi:hypothetical protein [Carboxylicivirga mesophila]|uniref:hypothetical protein n=1 Tax=Carboxylicivirga mesophila TaxID=1166478 RepID=UPI001FD278C5|nr:hypothetical protein [Carboxylicivirga mesophila]